MLAQRPPAVVEELLEIVLRALEQGNILLHPGRRCAVGNGLHDIFVLHGVETLGIVGEVGIVQHCGRAIYVARNTLERSDAVRSLGISLVAARQIVELVSPRIDGRVVAACSGAEYDALDRLHRSKQHAGRGLFTINIDRRIAILERDIDLHVVDLPRLVVYDTAVAGTALRAHLALVGQVDAGTSRALVIDKLDLEMTTVGLLGHQVELDRQLARMGNLSLDLGIKEGIFILECEPRAALLLVERNGCPDARIEVPHGQLRELLELREILVGMGRSLLLYGDRNAADPHILLIDAVGDPQIAILGHTVALLNTAHILRAKRLILTGIAHRGHLAVDQIQGRVFQTILRERNGQRPTELRGVIDRSK